MQNLIKGSQLIKKKLHKNVDTARITSNQTVVLLQQRLRKTFNGLPPPPPPMIHFIGPHRLITFKPRKNFTYVIIPYREKKVFKNISFFRFLNVERSSVWGDLASSAASSGGKLFFLPFGEKFHKGWKKATFSAYP